MKVANEIKRLKTYDQHCLPVKVKNISFWTIFVHECLSFQTAIVCEDDIYVNRVECNTAFDFDRVERMLISEPIPCPVKAGYSYVGVDMNMDFRSM